MPADRKLSWTGDRFGAAGLHHDCGGGRRCPFLGLALATGISALCWAGLAALVL